MKTFLIMEPPHILLSLPRNRRPICHGIAPFSTLSPFTMRRLSNQFSTSSSNVVLPDFSDNEATWLAGNERDRPLMFPKSSKMDAGACFFLIFRLKKVLVCSVDWFLSTSSLGVVETPDSAGISVVISGVISGVISVVMSIESDEEHAEALNWG